MTAFEIPELVEILRHLNDVVSSLEPVDVSESSQTASQVLQTSMSEMRASDSRGWREANSAISKWLQQQESRGDKDLEKYCEFLDLISSHYLEFPDT